MSRELPSVLLLTLTLLAVPPALAQDGPRATDGESPSRHQAAPGVITGTITLEGNDEPLHGVRVLLVELARTVQSDEEGDYRIENVPPGTYRLMAVRESLGTQRATVTVEAGGTATRDFVLSLTGVHEHVTVTASGRETTEFDAFNSVSVIDSTDIAQDVGVTLADVLEDEPGLAKRSFGPGNARPIIRGFDNDRVLIMQDGVRTGDLSSQSADHGVTLDPASVQRIEVVKGPATLLYGSNAIGGVVNTLSPQQQYGGDPPQELRGQVTVDGGSANEQLGGNGNFQYGDGAWMFWWGGGGRRTGDYDTPAGTIPNSGTELLNGRAGLGYFGDSAWLSVGYQIEDGRYGVPFADEFHGHHGEEQDEDGHEEEEDEELEIDISTRRQSVRVEAGLRDLGGSLVEGVRAVFSAIDWEHRELEVEGTTERVGTRFDNRTYIGRVEVHQHRLGHLSGQFGVWGQHRDYVAAGEEALSPPTTQRSVAAFAYEELDLDGLRLQFGGRVELNDYDAQARMKAGHGHDEEEDHENEEGHDDDEEAPEPRDRSFTGVSASAGVHVPVGDAAAVVATFTTAHRAPALEELYNFGPHVGNLAFEIGDPGLESERSNGGEVSFRIQRERVQAEVNGFYYGISDFVFGALTGEVVDDLQEVEFLQGDSRFVGLDGSADIRVHPKLRLKLGAGFVDAELTDTGAALPRIPPLHGRVGLEWRPLDQLVLRPNLRLAAKQDQVFGNEEPTDGYAVLDLGASYMFTGGKAMHILSAELYNVGDELYRNHTSFIKEFAPEMGRGVKLSYALRLF